MRQAVWQRGKDIGDVVLTLEDSTYGAHQDMLTVSGTVEGGRADRSSSTTSRAPTPSWTSWRRWSARRVQEDGRAAVAVPARQPPHGRRGVRCPRARRSPAAAAPQMDMIEQLRRLGELPDARILTEEEFAAQKAKILGASAPQPPARR